MVGYVPAFWQFELGKTTLGRSYSFSVKDSSCIWHCRDIAAASENRERIKG